MKQVEVSILENYDTMLRAIATGDRTALKQLFDLESPRMVGVAQRILGRRELAEEAVQDAFISIWRSASGRSGDEGTARAWIYAIVRNRSLSILRSATREDLAAPDDIEARRDTNPEIESAWRGLDSESALRRCLEELDVEKRAGVLMSHLYGYSHGEIAGHLRVPLGTAKSWVRRGLVALRECLS